MNEMIQDMKLRKFQEEGVSEENLNFLFLNLFKKMFTNTFLLLNLYSMFTSMT